MDDHTGMEPDRTPLAGPSSGSDLSADDLAPDVPDYLTMKQALNLIGDRFKCSVRTLRRHGVHEQLRPYMLGYRRGRTGIKRVPKSAVEEVMRIMHEGRIPS